MGIIQDFRNHLSKITSQLLDKLKQGEIQLFIEESDIYVTVTDQSLPIGGFSLDMVEVRISRPLDGGIHLEFFGGYQNVVHNKIFYISDIRPQIERAEFIELALKEGKILK